MNYLVRYVLPQKDQSIRSLVVDAATPSDAIEMVRKECYGWEMTTWSVDQVSDEEMDAFVGENSTYLITQVNDNCVQIILSKRFFKYRFWPVHGYQWVVCELQHHVTREPSKLNFQYPNAKDTFMQLDQANNWWVTIRGQEDESKVWHIQLHRRDIPNDKSLLIKHACEITMKLVEGGTL